MSALGHALVLTGVHRPATFDVNAKQRAGSDGFTRAVRCCGTLAEDVSRVGGWRVDEEDADLVNVMVQLAPEAADAVQGGRELPPELRDAEESLRPLELALEPLHPGAQDRSLASWFRISVEGETAAERVVKALGESPVVESAYVEPLSAPPA
jgi:hypothetical protein